MPKAVVKEASSNYPIPEDVLIPGYLVSCQLVEVPYTIKSGKRAGEAATFTKWEWEFKTEGEYGDLTVRGNSEPEITNADTPSGSLHLARPWIEALLGRDLGVGEDVDTDDLLGLPCQMTVRHQEPRPKKDGAGFWFNVEVDELFPAAGVSSDHVPF